MRTPPKTRGLTRSESAPGSVAVDNRPQWRAFGSGILGGIVTVGVFLLITVVADGTPTFTVARCLLLTTWVVGLGVVGILTDRRHAHEAGPR